MMSTNASRRATPVRASAVSKRMTTSAKVRVAINGFGRIGRNFLRCLEGRDKSDLEVVAVNDSGGVKQASHLLKYDSMLGTFDADVQILDDTHFSVNGKKITVVSNRDPTQLPWKDMKIDLVIEGTGVFLNTEGAGKHLSAGAKKVLITAPAKGSDIPTHVVGVNDQDLDMKAPIVSNASCTTNCLAPFVKVLDENFGIKQGTMTTTHSYTGDQRLLDASHRDMRRARAAALNIVPTTTGAAKAVSLVVPSLEGKLTGIALRVPTPNVSVVDLVVQVSRELTPATKDRHTPFPCTLLALPQTRMYWLTFDELFCINSFVSVLRCFKTCEWERKSKKIENPVVQVEKKTFAEEVNAAFREAADGPLKGVLGVTDEPLVSCDFRCMDVSTSIDSSLTMVMGDDMVKVVAWYDNEWGYSQRVVDLAEKMAKNL